MFKILQIYTTARLFGMYCSVDKYRVGENFYRGALDIKAASAKNFVCSPIEGAISTGDDPDVPPQRAKQSDSVSNLHHPMPPIRSSIAFVNELCRLSYFRC